MKQCPGIAAALLVVAFSGAGVAAEATDAATPRVEGGITYVTGGVGEREQVALQSVRNEYNLRITLAEKGSGAFLAGALVTIADGTGRRMGLVTAHGPWLYARVAPGNYTIEVEYEGTRAQQKLLVLPGAAREAYFYFPAPVEGTPAGP